jgi:hypothetical protein
MNDAILTKDNMDKRQWKRDPSCHFCNLNESMLYLLFSCSTARVVSVTFATCIWVSNIPSSRMQCWSWCRRWIPNGNKFYAVGIDAIWWAI